MPMLQNSTSQESISRQESNKNIQNLKTNDYALESTKHNFKPCNKNGKFQSPALKIKSNPVLNGSHLKPMKPMYQTVDGQDCTEWSIEREQLMLDQSSFLLSSINAHKGKKKIRVEDLISSIKKEDTFSTSEPGPFISREKRYSMVLSNCKKGETFEKLLK